MTSDQRRVQAPLGLEIRLFGGVDLRVNGKPLPPFPRRRELWLLALLVLKTPRESSRPCLAAALWPENHEQQALFYLRKTLCSVRKALDAEGARLLSAPCRSIHLNLDGAFVDVVAFDQTVSNPDRMEEAVALYRGPLLPECHEEWIISEREWREQAYRSALETLADRALAAGQTTAAIHCLQRLLAVDPYRESASRALMQALAERGDSAAITQVFRDLRHLLLRDLNVEPAPETEALFRLLVNQKRGEVPLPLAGPPPAGPPRRLPVPLTELIGRGKEMEEIAGWLRQGRLVTLVGAGGVGKTRLSTEAAEQAAEQFPDGVWFIDFAPLRDPALVTQLVLRQLGIREEPLKTEEESLEAALAPRSLLLLLDNCEHLLEACATLSHRLLSACPGLRILATSREPLGVTGEHHYRVPSLSLPAATEAWAEEVTSLLEYEAVRLFVARARQADAAFRLTRANAALVLQICRDLDGIPLAIEMAAARVNAFSLAQIAARMEERFELLRNGSRAALPRQRTLLAAVEWSHDLLTEEERLLFRRLCVFAGGWTSAAAASVCGGTDIAAARVPDVLANLVAKSLVLFERPEESSKRDVLLAPPDRGTAVLSGAPREGRYRMLETIRQYARRRVLESGEREECRDRHLGFFEALAAEADVHLHGPDPRSWLLRLEEEYDNLRAALEWSAKDPARATQGLRLGVALAAYWDLRGLFAEGREFLRRVLEAGKGEAVRARALRAAASLATKQGDYSAARRLTEECLVIYRRLGDPSDMAGVIFQLGFLTAGDGDAAVAKTYYQESLALYRSLGDSAGIAHCFNGMGHLACRAGQAVVARACFEESLRRFRKLGNRRLIAMLANNLGAAMFVEGDLDGARDLFTRSLEIRRELGARHGIAYCLESLAEWAAARDQPLTGSKLWGAAERLREVIAAPLPPNEIAGHERIVDAGRSAVADSAAFNAAWQEGRALPMEEAIDFALAASLEAP